MFATILKRLIAIAGLVTGIALICSGFSIVAPKTDVSYPKEYVRGDAYNFIIEASIRGGEISGAMTQKAIFLTGGSLVTLLSLLAFFDDRKTNLRKLAELTEPTFDKNDFKPGPFSE